MRKYRYYRRQLIEPLRHIDEELEHGKVTKYLYYPEFDNYLVTLEEAYKLYDVDGLCHLLKHNTVKCYQEFFNMDTTDEYVNGMKLVDFI